MSIVVKVEDLTGLALDWAVGNGEGLALRPAISASYEAVSHLAIPFTLKEVVCTYKGNVCVSAVVQDIKVTRCGINAQHGETAPSISFTDSKGRSSRGSIEMFFLNEAEAMQETKKCLRGSIWDFHPSTIELQGQPIIERAGFTVESFKGKSNDWRCFDFELGNVYAGETLLIASMRCYVAGKFGEQIEIPKELA